jgi:hypothetical protein
MSTLDKAALIKGFLTLLRKVTGQNPPPVTPGKTSPNYAPTVFARMEEGRPCNSKDYEEAMT